jgi:predicted nucleotidyltransferase
MDPSYFSPDILEFIRLLSLHKVRYLIVGGEAVIYYGFARLTGDIDIFYDSTKENAEALYAALKDFWEGKIPGVDNHTEFLQKGVIFQFGHPPNRIDLINNISGVIFEKAWPNRTLEEVEIKNQKYFVCYIGLEDLIKNKQNANRYKDLEDLKYLTALDKKK